MPDPVDPLFPRPGPPRGEDLPYDDGEPMETERHRRQFVLLIDTLSAALRGHRDAYVGGDMAVYYSELQAKAQDFKAPDFFVVLDVDPHERKSWVVWEEGGRMPDVVIEILSESTEQNDLGKKKDIYERVLRVPFYAVWEPFRHELTAWGIDMHTRKYVELPKDTAGRVECGPLGLLLGPDDGAVAGLTGPWLRWIDQTGTPLPTDEERARQAGETTRRLAEENERLRAELARRG